VSDTPSYRNSLTLGSMLHEYRLDSVLGAGGFGMTYLAWDVNLEKHVAIKEYLPGDLAVRALDGSIVPVNTESEYDYKWGLDRFIKEARTLARFSHPNIVRVNRFFEANGTSYMVMDYEAGESFYQYLKRNPAPSEAWLKQMLMPILDGLQAVHTAGFLHRDIKPSNVFIRNNGTPVLLDFGSARLAAGGASKNLTAIISPGYAPLEQYAGDGNQGPWSDIYALSGVMFRAITGENPPDAVRRMRDDTVSSALAGARGRYDERFLRAIEWGMTVEERVRPKGVEEWRELFQGRAPVTALDSGGVQNAGARPAGTAAAAVLTTAIPTVRNPSVPSINISHSPRPAAAAVSLAAPTAATRTVTRKLWKWIRFGAFLCLVLAAAAYYLKQRAIENALQQAATRQRAGRLAPELERDMTRHFESADADKSGAISRAELAQRLPAYAGRIAEIDSDGDGVVSLSELTAFMQKEGLADELRNSERKSASQEKSEAPAGKPEPERVELPESADLAIAQTVRQEFIGADRDGNGYLSRDEIRGRFPFIERNFSAVDSDGDGRISPAEFAQLRKQQKLQKPRP
jgi:serine/threonine protein kinase/Ca2+-binding EF-hand superfamily protein